MARVWLGKPETIRKVGFGLSVAITVGMLILAWIGPALLVRLEQTSFDFRLKLRGTRDPGSDIVLVAVDEKSLKELGRWPWSRAEQARLIRTIGADGPTVVGLDIIYAEPEQSEAYRALQQVNALFESAESEVREALSQRLAAADTDRQLAASVRNTRRVVVAFSFLVPDSAAPPLRPPAAVSVPDYVERSAFILVREGRSGEALEPYEAAELQPPLKLIADEAVGLGHVYTVPDPDGVTRREYLALRFGDEYYPSFALAVARVALGLPQDRMELTLGEDVRLGETVIPSDEKGRMLIDYVGPERSFPYISATDVIHQRVARGTFAGKVVLVGAAALGTYDQKATPFSANMPAIEKNATVIENILHQRFLAKSLWAWLVDAAVIVLSGLGLGWALPRMGAGAGALLAGAAVAGFAAVTQALFVAWGLWLDFVHPSLTMLAVFLSATVLRSMTHERLAREIRAMFIRYVSPQIVEELIRDPGKAKLGGERRELTMLFSDVVGFTAFSENRSAEEVVLQLNEYLGAMTEVVFRWNGTLDKFFGDTIVVFWGAPLDQPDHVELAVKCALHMRQRLSELQAKWKAEGKVPLEHGIGINTGMAVVGNIGADGKKMDYTMIGDQVNLAARVEGLTRKFRYPILLTEHTAERLKGLIQEDQRADNRGRLGHVALRALGSVKVKGKDKPVVVYGLETLDRGEVSRVDEGDRVYTLELTEK
jgi:adenylate cyclase